MANWFGRLFGRRNPRGDAAAQHDPQEETPLQPPAAAPQPSPSPAPPAPPAPPATASSPNATAGIPTDTLAQAREAAQALLADERMVEMLPAEAVAALRALLAPQPTAEQTEQGMAALAAIGAALEASRVAALLSDLPQQLQAWYVTPSWPASRHWLMGHLAELPPDAPEQLEAAATRGRELGDDDGAASLQRHGIILREARRIGVDAAYQAIIGERAFTEEENASDDTSDGGELPAELRALIETIEAWINTPDWNASRAYLKTHADTLLTDAAVAALSLMLSADNDADNQRILADHQRLLREARASDIDAAYDAFLRNRPQQSSSQLTPDVEMNTLLVELGAIDTDREPARAEALCRQILALDDERRALTSQLRGAVLGTLANALQAHSRMVSGTEGLAALDEAVRCYDLALLEYRREVAPLDWAGTQNNKGNALQERAGRLGGAEGLAALDEAVRCYDLALLERRREVAPLQWATTQNNKGNALKERAGRLGGAEGLAALDEAVRCYDLALAMYPLVVQPDEHRRRARVLASALLRRALAPESAGVAREQTLDRAWAHISSSLKAARDLALREALVSFRQQEWAENARVFTLAAAITALRGVAALPATRRDHLAQAIALLEEGRARGLAEAAGRRSADLALLADLDRRRYVQAVNVVQAIEAQSRQLGDPLALAAEARAADERLKSVVADLRARYSDFLPEPDVSLPTLARGLSAGEALIYLMPLEVGTLLLAVGSSGEPIMRWLGKLTSDAIFALAVQPNARGNNRCGYLPAALGWGETPLDQALDALLPRLGDDLMRVVVGVTRELRCHRAVLVAGGFLSVMPLHAATYAPLDGEPASAPGGRRYACDDVAFTYAPSGLTLLASRATAQRQAQAGPARRALVVGNPQLTRQGKPWAYDPDTRNGYLPFAEWEAHRVAELASERVPPLQVDLKTNGAATWAAVHDGLPGADLAHLSLHARFDAVRPDRSALLVAFQSSLYLRDLLDTREGALDHLRLIVLSACQSGQSDVQHQSEEAVGLFGALLAAGAPAVIGTLWSVNDLATARFMESFARRAYRDGVAPDAALRAAARELRGVSDDLAAPAETGATLREQWSVEEIIPEQPHRTPARAAIAQGLAQQPELASASREMSLVEWQAAQQALAEYRRMLIERRGVEHPMYWAAFVYYGAPVSLAGDDPSSALPNAGTPQRAITASVVGATTRGETFMASDDQRDNDQNGQDGRGADEALPIAEARAASYFPEASEVCPRCHAEDYLPVRDASGQDVRQCVSCHQLYGAHGSGEGSL